jgi:Zn-finger nucleic acid-binding protein
VAECDNCGAPIRFDRLKGVFVCDHCGSQREAPAVIEHVELLNETTSLCPICSTPLSTSRLEGHALLCCARCYGMLIDMNRFATVIDAVRAREERPFRIALPRRQNPGDRLLNCPKCRQPMLCHIYGGPGNVVIDSCERCQLNWLDPGELRRIAMAPDSTSSA